MKLKDCNKAQILPLTDVMRVSVVNQKISLLMNYLIKYLIWLIIKYLYSLYIMLIRKNSYSIVGQYLLTLSLKWVYVY